MQISRIALLTLVLTLTASAFAQKNEIGLTAGAYFPIGTNLDIVPAAVVEGSYARRIVSVPLAAVYAEVPVAKTFDIGVFSNVASFSALFVAPGVKLKIAPSFPISPWVALGGGVAHFSASASAAGFSASNSANTGLVDFGGGLDFKVAPFLSLRTQARDYYSGSLTTLLPGNVLSRLPVSLLPGRQHNLIASAGIVIRF